MSTLIWVDWVIIAIVSISTLVSLKRGFVKEALSLVIWVAAFIIARTFHPHLQTLLIGTIETESVRLIAAFGILFIGTLIVGAIISNLVGALVRLTGLTATDRVLGMAFGLARGVVVVVVAVALLRYTPVTQDTWWRTSPLIQQATMIEQWTRRTFGSELQSLPPTPSQVNTGPVG
ncbi:CvpA family protein [Hydrocarboniclastica marina]|uniref:CvpA family protein n=1 Tax=Hydrocarboniclastica marina TaxID=2259620 RepID=A0A4P7XHQ7_9ALTE|nr:CvpA family protein [Hydrocarboniclastica marina]QCF26203.1 CvpA family protein [Hydrocarboniclastica marina]